MNAQQRRNRAALVEELCNRIQRRALRSKAANFHVSYAGHVDTLTVIARSRDHNYMAKAETWPAALIDRYIDLLADDAVEKLTAVLNEMRELERKKA